MNIDGVYCLPLELKEVEADEVKVVWDHDNEMYVIPTLNGQGKVVLHEDGTWREPTMHALALAWGVCRSMNSRHNEAMHRRQSRIVAAGARPYPE